MKLSTKNEVDVTVAIINYNRSKFLDRSVRSCLDQSLIGKTQEIIVVDERRSQQLSNDTNIFEIG